MKVEKVPVLGRPAPMRTYSTSTESFVMARYKLQRRRSSPTTNTGWTAGNVQDVLNNTTEVKIEIYIGIRYIRYY